MSDETEARQPPAESGDDATGDLGYRDDEENRAYERGQPDSQPEVSSEPEPDDEPADAG
jgi:hypothetical protein